MIQHRAPRRFVAAAFALLALASIAPAARADSSDVELRFADQVTINLTGTEARTTVDVKCPRLEYVAYPDDQRLSSGLQQRTVSYSFANESNFEPPCTGEWETTEVVMRTKSVQSRFRPGEAKLGFLLFIYGDEAGSGRAVEGRVHLHTTVELSYAVPPRL